MGIKRDFLLFNKPSSRTTTCSMDCLVKLIMFFFLGSFTLAMADLSSDQQALLSFSAAVPHIAGRIDWSSNSAICSSWAGVSCSGDGARVVAVRLPGVGLIGQIPPDTLGKLDALQILSLRSNRLSGSLPSDLLSLPSLRYLFLQGNHFSGDLPAEFPSGLIVLDLSSNSFTGQIPSSFKNLSNLTALSLANNSLSGPIPDLHLSNLRRLNLKFNNLTGSIPLSLGGFSSDSFAGNALLCGAPLAKCPEILPSPSQPASSSQQPPSKSGEEKNKLPIRVVIAIAAAGGLAVLVLLTVAIILYLLKRTRAGSGMAKAAGEKPPKEDLSSGAQEADKNKLVFFDTCSYHFDLEDLLRASAEVLGKGSYGTAYKAVLEEGTMVVVKRLKEMIAGKKEFEQQMELVGRLASHQNIAPFRAYYYSKDEKLLVYDYYPAGSFSALLHGKEGKDPLDWDSRVRIALGAARGIAHIHSEGGGKLFHGNVKSSNVLLSGELEPCLADVGLAPMMSLASSRAVDGYRAPETKEARKFTQKSDVYSFGVVLLEMLTGKSPVAVPGKEETADLSRWVQSVVREEWTAEVFDVDLMRQDSTEEDMVQMLQIAMACVARVPDQRPTMDEVVALIEGLARSKSSPP